MEEASDAGVSTKESNSMRVSQWETRTGLLLRVPRTTNTALIPGALLEYQDFPLNIVVTPWQEVELTDRVTSLCLHPSTDLANTPIRVQRGL